MEWILCYRILVSFYRAIATHSADYVWQDVCPSVRPSVCLSVTRRYTVETAERIMKLFHRRVPAPFYTVSVKKDRQYFGRNFYKFWQLFIIFGTNYLDNLCDWKIVKCPINTYTTLRNDDVIVTSLKNTVFARRETPEFILPLLWPPNSPDLNPVD